jgi:Ser/Thr protein kinase RdoA (MazF antagonist)
MASLNGFLDNLTDEKRVEFFLRLAAIALKQYSIGEYTFVFLQQNSNVTFRVDLSDHPSRFLMKIHELAGSGPKASYEQIQAQMEWLDNLAQTSNLVVQTPVRNREEMFVTRVLIPETGENVLCTLQHWVEGEHPDGDFTLSQAKAVGAMMAALHQASSHWQLSKEAPLADYQFPDLLEEVKQLHTVMEAGILSYEQFSVLERAVQQMEQMVYVLGKGVDVYGAIHGDLHHENILFLDEKVRPIDFDGLKNSYYLFDLGTTLYHILYQDVGFRKALIDGYSSLCFLPVSQHRTLEAFVTWSAINNLAFQSTIPKQIHSKFFVRNIHQLTNEFCPKVIANEPFVLVEN